MRWRNFSSSVGVVPAASSIVKNLIVRKYDSVTLTYTSSCDT